MASSVGCWTSSSKVGRSGFFSFFSSYHVRRCFWTHTLIPSPLVGILDCTFARVLYSTALFIRLYIPMLFYAFLWVFWVSSSGASTSGNAPFVRRFATFFINFLSRVRTRASLQSPSPTSLRFPLQISPSSLQFSVVDVQP